MTISVGDKLPDATFAEIGAEGPTQVSAADALGSGKIALFAVPGAFTPTCHQKHMPGFVANADKLREAGIDAIVCTSVNDPFVMKAWGEHTGATEAGIRMLSDPEGKFAQALGLDFSAPPVGLISRSQRYAMLVEDGVVKVLNVEGSPGEVSSSAAEALLEAM